MTWKIAVLTAVLVAASAGPAAANDEFMPFTYPVALDPANAKTQAIGKLTYRGGVVIEPGEDEEEIGGISGLKWQDGVLYAVSDGGEWLILTPSEIGDKLTDVIAVQKGALLDERGKPLKGDDEVDAEALARTADGQWLVAFERNHRIWRYATLGDKAEVLASPLVNLAASSPPNGALEALAFTPGGLLACVEHTAAPSPLCAVQEGEALTAFDAAMPPLLAERGGAVTGADCASNGVCYILFRSWSEVQGNAAAIVAVGPDGLQETFAEWTLPLTIDNFEGIAVREAAGRTYLYLVSDNNFSEDQRTLLLKFEVDANAAAAPGVPPKVYATQLVVFETSMGDITVSLETERAPITAANFLRYVAEDRYDGTKCYRAMRVAGGEQPSGFLQCGTQNDPARILEGIAHEPTHETGLSHTDGALSMARFEPGTATGDFSIMIRDQRGLDAVPDSDDPDRRPGFAVFGYVVDGMDVVHAIHATPTDPDKGEGFLKGQMLAEPVTIMNIRVVESSAEE